MTHASRDYWKDATASLDPRSCSRLGSVSASANDVVDHHRDISRGGSCRDEAQHIKDLGKEFVEELEEFFVSYHELSGKQYRILDVRGPKEAERRIRDGMRRGSKKN